MKKSFINKISSKFGFEVNGLSYMQSLRKSAVVPSVFLKQKEILKNGVKTIFDLGANYGNITREYKNIFPEANIYAFEPFPEVFKVLKENVAALNGIKVYQKAVADQSGIRTFYVNENADTNSLFKSQKSGLNSDVPAKNKYSIDVETISLDEFCKENQIREIDILKMDIQGGEMNALKGVVELLKTRKINLIYTEAYFIQQYERQPLFNDLMNYLYDLGYQLQDIYNPYYGKGSLAWCDAIFLPRK